MKKTDVAMIILIASFSVITAFFTARYFFGDKFVGSAKVKTIEKISTTVAEPDSKIFNADAINPAVKIQIDGTQ
jgi:hypothetical protein